MNLQELKQDYEFFSSIPDDKWITNDYCDGYGKCALGHKFNIEKFDIDVEDPKMIKYALEIKNVFQSMHGLQVSLPDVNDGDTEFYQQPTPKERVLAFFSDAIEAKEAVEEVKEILKEELELV